MKQMQQEMGWQLQQHTTYRSSIEAKSKVNKELNSKLLKILFKYSITSTTKLTLTKRMISKDIFLDLLILKKWGK